VRRWIPELAHIGGAAVHTPWELGPGGAPDYPPRIVDHRDATLHERARHGAPDDATPPRNFANRARA
jgi:deoxyribodipyrimidine photo-lyase